MLIRDLMNRSLPVVYPDTPLWEVAQVLLEFRLSSVPVVNEQGIVCGVLSDSDFGPKEAGVPFSRERLPQLLGQWMPREGGEAIYAEARNWTAKDVMNPEVVTVSEDTTIEDALRTMLRRGVRDLLVVRDKTPVGIVSCHDLLLMMV